MVVYTYKVNVNSLAQIICIMEFDLSSDNLHYGIWWEIFEFIIEISDFVTIDIKTNKQGAIA